MEAPQDLTFLVTRRCNFSCAYCYRGGSAPGRLTWQRISNASAALLPRVGLVRVDFSGGEPLLEFDLIKRYVEAAMRGEFGAVAFVWGISTNGHLLSEDRLAWLRARQFRIRLSLQVDPRRPEQRELSLRAMNLIDKVGGFAPGDDIAITVVPGSAGAVAVAVRAAIAAGAPEVILAPDMIPGAAALESETDWVSVLRSLVDRSQSNGKHHPVRNLRPRPPGTEARESGPCAAAEDRSVAVDVDGRVWTCSSLIPESDLPDELARETTRLSGLGDPHVPGFMDRRTSRQHDPGLQEELSSAPPRVSQCDECHARQDCFVCPGTKLRMRAQGIETPGEFFCAFTRALATVRADERERER